jgi:hypothetical protein
MTFEAAQRNASPPGGHDASQEYSHDTSLPAPSDTSVEVLDDTSIVSRHDASTAAPSDTCRWCHRRIPADHRSDSLYCCKAHRQAAWRFGRAFQVTTRAAQPLRIKWADPPYPGLSQRYYQDHPDYSGEVDHAELLSRLAEADGWALSTSSRALPKLLSLCVARGLEVRVASWHRGARPTRSTAPLQAWEPVLYVPARHVVEDDPGEDALDYVCRPRLTDVARVIGTKPAEYIAWIFRLTGARPGDDFEDMFPGSGGASRAWDIYCERSLPPGGDTSGRRRH